MLQADPYASEYVAVADYSGGYEQWQEWHAQHSRRTRGRSLLSDFVDPRVQRHMLWVATVEEEDSKPPAKVSARSLATKATSAWPTVRHPATTPDDRFLSKSRWPPRDDTVEYNYYNGYNNHNHDFDNHTKATEFSDDSSRFMNPPGWSEDEETVVHPPGQGLPNTLVLEQEAMIQAMERQQQHHERQQQQHLRHRRKKGHVTLWPKDRVRRAMERGNSIRVLSCSGCSEELFVTPDNPLVYCPVCACFSQLPLVVSSS